MSSFYSEFVIPEEITDPYEEGILAELEPSEIPDLYGEQSPLDFIEETLLDEIDKKIPGFDVVRMEYNETEQILTVLFNQHTINKHKSDEFCYEQINNIIEDDKKTYGVFQIFNGTRMRPNKLEHSIDEPERIMGTDINAQYVTQSTAYEVFGLVSP